MPVKSGSSQYRLNGTMTEQGRAELDYVQKSLGLSKQGETVQALLDAYRELEKLKNR